MNTRTLKLALVPALLMTLVACSSEQGGNAAVSPKPESSPAPVEASAQPTAAPEATPAPSEAAGVAVGDIKEYKDIAINDWKDDTTVVVSKENDKLGPMSLEELSGNYPH